MTAPRPLLQLLIAVAAVVAAVLAAIAGFALWLHASGSAPLPFAEFVAQHRSSDATVRDRHGEAVATLRVDATVRRLEWVPLAQVSPALVPALLAAEDRRFHDHAGVDWLAVLAAARSALGPDGKARGASGISMQMAALLNTDLARRSGGRGLRDKLLQVRAALALERGWSKAQILEAYVNTVAFRGELSGIAAASWALFGKHPGGLDRREAAILAALIRAPNATTAQVTARACAVLRHTHPDASACPRDELKTLLARATRNPQPVASIAPHLAQRVASAAAGADERATTIDAGIQRAAAAALNEQLLQLQAHGVEDGAVVVLDNASGDVLAYVGSSGAISHAEHVDAARARRQAGSTLKPFLYALALDQRRLTAASLLDDSPLGVPTDAGLYVPQNYDRRFVGPVSVRKALASSLNIPAVRAVQVTGADEFHAKLNELRLDLVGSAEHHGVALALGSADVRLIDLTNAYRALANGGRLAPVRVDRDAPSAAGVVEVFTPQTAWLIGHILSDNAARAHTFGFDSVLATPFWSAAKTGTSKDMRDNWCIGWSARYTVGVWVGNASGRPMAHVSGVSGAAPAWADVMRHLHARSPSPASEPPQGVQAMRVRFDGVDEAARTEWFASAVLPPADVVKGAGANQPPIHTVALAAPAHRPAITYPQDGAWFAWDPDIPDASSGFVPQHSAGADAALAWRVNGKLVRGPHVPTKRLERGDNVIELVDRSGRVLDRVRVELRGKPRDPSTGSG